MRLLIDSNRFIDFCAGEEEVVQNFETAEALVVPFVVLAEIRAGSLMMRRGESQMATLHELLQQPGVRTAHTTDTTAHHYASIYQSLRRKGTPIPSNDIWIAALAIEHGLVLYTRDRHFDHVGSVPKLG